MRDMLEARKRGDLAFRDKDFKTAIDCYSQVCAMSSITCMQRANCWNPPYVTPHLLYIEDSRRIEF